MDYAEVCNMFNDEVSEACARAELRGLELYEVIQELTRITQELINEVNDSDKSK